MKKSKLNYRFHNPNPVHTSANYIFKIMMEANKERVGQAVRKSVVSEEDGKEKQGLSFD